MHDPDLERIMANTAAAAVSAYSANGDGTVADPPIQPERKAKPRLRIAPPVLDEVPAIIPRFPNTDYGNAQRLVARHGEDLHFCHTFRKWLVWDGTRFRLDDMGEVERRAKQTVRAIYTEAEREFDPDLRAALAQHASKSEAASRIGAMIALAQSEPGVPVRPPDLDRDHWLLNCPNGVVELRSGRLREHRRLDLITKLCPVEYRPDADCVLWRKVLGDIFAGKEGIVGYLQRLAGYSLTGDVSEQVLTFFYGHGANGKSTLLDLFLDLLGGDYALKAVPDLLLVKKGESHPTERADLFGRRFVACIENDEGRRLAEGIVKDLTGGDKQRARRMREDFWEFSPTHKIVLATNHRPVIRGTDHAIWRRIHLVPFEATFADDKRDKNLPEKLRKEMAGILNWCVQGCLEWQKMGGLAPPSEILAATGEYRDEQDVLAGFLDECCFIHREAKATAANLYSAYVQWCKRNGETEVPQRKFGMTLSERGFDKDRGAGGTHWWKGIGVTEVTEVTLISG